MEIKVLNKTFDLLELVREWSPHPVLPGEAAAALDMPRSTCVRLLRLLTEKGYLEQLSPRKGYTVGPLLLLLGSGNCYRRRLTLHASTLLEALSREMECSMQFFMRWSNCRLVLCGFNGDELLNLEIARIRRYDLNTSISGRMLLSRAPLAEQQEIIASWGGNLGVFQGMAPEEICAELARFRECDLCIDSHKGKFAAAVMLKNTGSVNMGIGAVWREENDSKREKIIEALRKCASKLSDIINVENFA